MNKPLDPKTVLHRLLQGMDPYLSCGVPEPIWNLAVDLTREVYGPRGVRLLNRFHHTYEDNLDANTVNVLHSVHGWKDRGSTEIVPNTLIPKLEALKRV